MSIEIPEGYALVPVKPSPRMIIDMAWWCRELSLSTGDLVEFWESMIESAKELDDEY